MKRDIDLFWSLKFYWINSNKGDKRIRGKVIAFWFHILLDAISLMFWNFFTLLLTISSWFLSKGTDFSFWLCQHKCGDEWSHSQVTPIKLSLHLGAECYPQGISSNAAVLWHPVPGGIRACPAVQRSCSHHILCAAPWACYQGPHFVGSRNRVTSSFCCSPFHVVSKTYCSHHERDSSFYSLILKILQRDFSFRGDLLGLTSSAPVRTRVLSIKLRSNWG